MKADGHWTEAELAELRLIYASTETIESMLHRLPGRSLETVMRKAFHIGLAKARVPSYDERIAEVMKDGAPRSAEQMATAIGVRKKLVGERMRLALKAGTYHIVDYLGTMRQPVYVMGPGENAKPPLPRREAEREEARRVKALARMRERRQEIATGRHVARVAERPDPAIAWWPRADVVAAAAFHSMVSLGRAAA